MKKTKSAKVFALNVINKLAVASAEKSANATCGWYSHQPVLPPAVKKMRKF